MEMMQLTSEGVRDSPQWPPCPERKQGAAGELGSLGASPGATWGQAEDGGGGGRSRKKSENITGKSFTLMTRHRLSCADRRILLASARPPSCSRGALAGGGDAHHAYSDLIPRGGLQRGASTTDVSTEHFRVWPWASYHLGPSPHHLPTSCEVWGKWLRSSGLRPQFRCWWNGV